MNGILLAYSSLFRMIIVSLVIRILKASILRNVALIEIHSTLSLYNLTKALKSGCFPLLSSYCTFIFAEKVVKFILFFSRDFKTLELLQ